MRYQNACIESLGYSVPDEVVSSEEIESRLEPLYERLRLPEGRLELMTGIRERRFWPQGILPSEPSIQSANLAIEAANFDRGKIGVLIHASVCRDHLEPATACRVHHALQLPQNCIIYDVSNACLGLLNGALQIANMIELGQVEAGIVVGTEDSRHLVETTIAALNADPTLTRNSIKFAVASLTIGSADCAMLITHDSISRSKCHIMGASVRANTVHHALCQSGRDEAVGSGMQPLMETDSENLMKAGISTGVETFQELMSETRWATESIDRTVCHQVGIAHRKLMLQSLGLSPQNDFATMHWLGNTGSVALPVTLAVASERSFLRGDQNVALLGIGSGINCIMIAARWQDTPVLGAGEVPSHAADHLVS